MWYDLSVVCRNFARSEIGAVVVWIIGSLVLAAVLAPWVCRGGQWLAGLAQEGDLPRLIEWVAESCGRAKFSRFFDRSLLFSALVLLPLLVARIRRIRAGSMPALMGYDHALGWRKGVWQLLVGFLFASVLLAALCLGLALSGAFEPRPEVGGVGRFLKKAVVPALFAAPLEEWLFRGVLYGIWLRFVKPWPAVMGTALLFSLLHFLHPPSGVGFADPQHPLAGFQLLGTILQHFTNPLFFVTDFATLLFVGMILGWARMKTGALWFSIGLHGGWIVVLKTCSFFYVQTPDHFLRPWWIGDSLRSGMLPIVALAATMVLCLLWMRFHTRCCDSAAKQGDRND
jgi:membrane protease YdiL (CAAX protease family)